MRKGKKLDDVRIYRTTEHRDGAVREIWFAAKGIKEAQDFARSLFPNPSVNWWRGEKPRLAPNGMKYGKWEVEDTSWLDGYREVIDKSLKS